MEETQLSSDRIEEREDIEEELEHVCMNKDVVLSLNYKNLIKLPGLIAVRSKDYQHVSRIYLKGNLLQSLPAQISVLKNLVEIYAPCNQISDIPDSICDLMNLQCLDVSSNALTSLPCAIGKLRCLEKLQLSNNQIRRLPAELGYLQCLSVLEVMNNCLCTLPVELSHCSALRRILVDRNNLQWLPRQLCQLPHLEELSASGNKLLCLPAGLGDMNSLKAVYVDNNPLLHAIPVSLSNQEIGFNSCGRWNFEPVSEAHYRWQHLSVTVDQEVKNLYLPKEITVMGDRDTSPVISLMELSMRAAYQNIHLLRIHEGDLPQDLYESIQCPTARCQSCTRPIFSMAFPMIFEGQIRIYRLCRLALCCSSYCVHLASLIVNLPLLYPSPTNLFMAVALVDNSDDNLDDDIDELDALNDNNNGILHNDNDYILHGE